MPPSWKSRLYQRYTSEHILPSGQLRAQIAVRMPYLKRLIQRYFPANRSVRILDLGCGYGALLIALKEAGYTNCCGIDVSLEQIEAARSLDNLDVACEDLFAYLRAQPDAAFDLITVLDVLEHFTREELLPLIDEIARVLLPGGRLIVHVPNGEAITPGVIRYGDLTHELAFTQASLRQLAHACGLKAVAFAEDRPVAHGAISAIRAVLWWTMTLNFRLLRMAETGCGFRGQILSQNMLAILIREGD